LQFCHSGTRRGRLLGAGTACGKLWLGPILAFVAGQARQVFAEMQRGIAPPPDIISITSLITACEKGLGFLQVGCCALKSSRTLSFDRPQMAVRSPFGGSRAERRQRRSPGSRHSCRFQSDTGSFAGSSLCSALVSACAACHRWEQVLEGTKSSEEAARQCSHSGSERPSSDARPELVAIARGHLGLAGRLLPLIALAEGSGAPRGIQSGWRTALNAKEHALFQVP